MRTMRLLVCLGILISPSVMLAEQNSVDVAGQWTPRDRTKADALFAMGLSDVTSAGMRIEQSGDRLSITRLDSDGALAAMQGVNDRFEIQSIYTRDAARSTGGHSFYKGNSSSVTLDGSRLVIDRAWPQATVQTVYTLENGSLKAVSVASMANGAANRIVQYYERVNR